MAIDVQFERYLEPVVNILNDAQNAAVVSDPNDDDQVDYVDRLREACLNSYTGILQGFKGVDETAARRCISTFVQSIVQLIIRSSQLEPVPPSDSLMATTAGLIGDLVGLYGQDIVGFFNIEAVTQMLQTARKSKVAKTRSMSSWASKEMKKFPSNGAASFNFNR
uniref:Importin subunit beta-1/Transportin-1-like TPR repeats domain-containing protein n=1 Tax=Caenorhabditis japonica TaxID=281687 RepID=A0A8R1IAM1_CAEJA